MSLFFTGSIKIISVSKDVNGVITETVGSEINARVEDFNRLIINQRGQENLAEMIIYIDKKYSIKIDDKIMVITKEGNAYFNPLKKWKIIKLANIGGFKLHHIEAYV